jgi:hypothetical protein
MVMRTVVVVLLACAVSACFPDRTLNKACTDRSPCVIEGDACIDGVCIRGLPIDVAPVDAGVSDAGVTDAGVDDAGVDDAGVDDAGETDASTA